MTLGQRIRRARKAAQKSQPELGKLVGVTRNAVSQWESDTSDPTPERLRDLAVALDVDYEWLATGRRGRSLIRKGLPLLGEIAAGVWAEVQESQDMKVERVPVAPVPDYPPEAQYALKIKGNSVNRVAPDGTIIIVVDIIKADIEIRDGDLVHVERRRGSLVETTLKRVRKGKKGPELWPESDDANHQGPIRVEAGGDTEVIIRGLVLYTVRPVARGG